MFYVPQGLMKRFSGGFLISISLPATDLECLIKNFIFNLLKFRLRYMYLKTYTKLTFCITSQGHVSDEKSFCITVCT